MVSEARPIAERWFELHNDGTPDNYGTDRYLSLYADDVECSTFPSGAQSRGVESLREAHRKTGATFRNRHAGLYELIVEGPHAAMRYAWQATAARELPGIPAGTTVSYDIAHFITVNDGRIIRSHEYQVRLP